MSQNHHIVLENCYLFKTTHDVSIITGKISSGFHDKWKWYVGNFAYVYWTSIELVEKKSNGNFVIRVKDEEYQYELASFNNFFDDYDVPWMLNRYIEKTIIH